MEKARLTFNKGMMPDADISVRPQGAYEDALNLSATPNATGSIGALSVAKGCLSTGTLPTNYSIVGHTTIGDTGLIVFAVNTVTSDSTIYNLVNPASPVVIYTDASSTTKLNFSVDHPIDAVGRYETEESQKVYWAQDNQPLRVLNLANTYTSTQPATIFDIVPEFKTGSISTNPPTQGGSLQSGRVQYCFKLAVKYGQSTGFSEVTQLVNLFTVENNAVEGIVGVDKDVNTGKQIDVSVSIPADTATLYNVLQIYRIHYETKGLPVIHLISEQDITEDVAGTYTYLDTGENLDEVSLETFNSTGSRYFYAKTIAAKDNILFAANIVEPVQELNIDCRAYRFGDDGGCRIMESNGSYYIITSDLTWTKYTASGTVITTGVDWTSIPTDADCINEFNDEFKTGLKDTYSTVNNYEFIYKTPATRVVGGKGPIVNYTIIRSGGNYTNGRLIGKGNVYYVDNDNTGDTFYYDKESFTHKPGEIYRYGIVWFDKKGKAFPVKWIGDIRIPPTWKSYTVDKATQLTVDSHIRIEFNVNFAAIPTEEKTKVSGYMYVRVPKDVSNRQIVASGATWKAYKVADTDFRHRVWTVNSIDTYSADNCDYIHPFYSPELFFNSGIDFSGSSYLAKVTGIIPMVRYAKNTSGVVTKDGASASTIMLPEQEAKSIGEGLGQLAAGTTFSIKASAKLNITEKNGAGITLAAATNSNFTFTNRTINETGTYHEMYGPTCGIFTTKVRLYKGFPYNAKIDGVYETGYGASQYLYTIDIYRDNAKGAFGGNTYQARSLNSYVQASSFKTLSTSTTTCYGDIKTTVFECLSSIHDPNFADNDEGGTWGAGTGVDRRQVVTLLPMASYVDCSMSKIKPSRLAFDAYYIPPSSATSGSNRVGLQETTVKGISLYGEKYPTDLPDYISYNTAYSETGSYPTYSSEKLSTINIEKLPFTVLASEKKTNGETSDSWTTFKYANVLDVDTEGGQINALNTTDNKLFFWQDRSTGIISTNDRYIINEGTVGQLSLGTGGILERYDYISSKIGCERKQQISASENELFWMFDKLKRVYSYGTELQDLGLVYGCSSLINSKYPTKGLVYYDYIEDEVLFKLSDCVLVFDPVLKAFVSRLKYVPTIFIKRPDYNYMSSGDGRKFYTHNNVVRKGIFYTDTYEACSLTVTENQSFDIVKVYDTLNWSTSNFTNGQYANYGDQFDSTFNKLEISNDYQYSGELTISPQRRQRDFTLALPRDISSISEVDSTTNSNYPKFDGSTLKFKRRFRDRYLRLKFTKDDTILGHSQDFKLHYIDVNYRKSIR